MAIMGKATVGIRELKDRASSIIDRVEEGEAITVTKHGRPVARIVSAATPPHLSALIADGTVRPAEGPRYLPAKPAKLRGRGKTAAQYISEGRR
jgi:prevent-host-death family protein